jgi:hypothetical protein
MNGTHFGSIEKRRSANTVRKVSPMIARSNAMERCFR